MALRIITDSASDLPAAKAERKRVEVVPLTVQFGPATYYDGKTLTNDLFYKLLTAGEHHPTTAQPSPEAFLKLFEAARAQGDEVLCILLASKLSGTCQSASIARGMCGGEGIYIVDSATASGGIQILLNYACKLRDSGLGGADIAAALERVLPRIRAYAVVDTLEYLRKGGRLSTAQAVIGTVSRLKPVICVHDGAVTVASKAFGQAAAVKQLLKLIGQHPVDDTFPSYFVYTDSDAMLDSFADLLRGAGLLPTRMHTCGLGATLGTHVGPGAFGLIYMAAE